MLFRSVLFQQAVTTLSILVAVQCMRFNQKYHHTHFIYPAVHSHLQQVALFIEPPQSQEEVNYLVAFMNYLLIAAALV